MTWRMEERVSSMRVTLPQYGASTAARTGRATGWSQLPRGDSRATRRTLGRLRGVEPPASARSRARPHADHSRNPQGISIPATGRSAARTSTAPCAGTRADSNKVLWGSILLGVARSDHHAPLALSSRRPPLVQPQPDHPVRIGTRSAELRRGPARRCRCRQGRALQRITGPGEHARSERLAACGNLPQRVHGDVQPRAPRC